MKLNRLLLLFLFPLASYAADGPGLTRSAGKYVIDDSVQLAEKLSVSNTIKTGEVSRSRADGSSTASAGELSARIAQHPFPVVFEIFDAWVELSGDLDFDGFYHQIKLTFDADVNSDVETVYVKLYLSHEGGDWYQYATSDLFEIHYDSVDDTYEVVTELVDGYLPGYYDVMIELHSLYHPGIVASAILDSYSAGIDIALEDLHHDEAQREVFIDDGYAYGHSGSFSLAGLIMLGGILWIKMRYFRRKIAYCPIKSSRASQNRVG